MVNYLENASGWFWCRLGCPGAMCVVCVWGGGAGEMELFRASQNTFLQRGPHNPRRSECRAAPTKFPSMPHNVLGAFLGPDDVVCALFVLRSSTLLRTLLFHQKKRTDHVTPYQRGLEMARCESNELKVCMRDACLLPKGNTLKPVNLPNPGDFTPNQKSLRKPDCSPTALLV